MSAQLQHKRGTALAWATKNPILADGEFGIEKDTGIIKVGNGFTSWNDLAPAFSSQFLPRLGTAADSEKLNGLTSAAYLKTDDASIARTSSVTSVSNTVASLTTTVDGRTLPASATRKLVSHWGVGTSFPVVGVLPGDTCVRSDVGTNGSHWIYVGGSSGKSGWIHKGPLICTSTTRPVADVYVGLEIYETDTSRECYYDGAKWRNGGIGINRNMGGVVNILGGAEFQMGMVKLLGNGTGSITTAVIFPVAFSATPLVFANAYGYMATSGPFAPTGTVNWEGWSANAGEASPTQFTARVRRNDGSIFSAASDYYFNWFAIGVK